MEPYVFRTNFLYRVPSPQFHHSHGLRFMKLTLKSAPTAHRVRETVDRLSRDIPDYISPLRWPPNSPDLNPVDYAIWGKLQERVYRDVDHLVERFVEKWIKFDQTLPVLQLLNGKLVSMCEGGHMTF